MDKLGYLSQFSVIYRLYHNYQFYCQRKACADKRTDRWNTVI